MATAAGSSNQKGVPSGTKKDKNQNIQVVVRCRPLNSAEKKSGGYSLVEVCPDKKEITVKERAVGTAPLKTFTYDRVFPGTAKQIEIYKTVVTPLVAEVLLGYNCTVFAYGQTGTGKTFTMEGERSEDPSVSWEDDPLSGIIPRAMNQLFSSLQKQGCEFTVRVSFLEIYNEELIDLLGAESVENPRLKIYEDNVKKGACIIQGLEEVVVNNKDEVYQILQQGAIRRQTACTLMNAHSSRSHTLFMVTIHIKENSVDGEELLKTGKLNLVDLAGSECIGRSGAVDKRAREAGNINQSLLTLGRVITSLVEHAPHIPYRESKLTRLLQDSLGGRTKTSIIATISPASTNLDETLSTLDYAFRARNITNKPEINQKLTKKALLKEYTEEIERMRKDLQAARDKNGVYLAEENYIAMQTRIAQQEDSIKELDGKIQVASTEMLKLNELFTETQLVLEEKAKELQETGKKLEVTTTNLRATEVKLDKTAMQRDVQKHLVGVHVKTEHKLHSQATKLLSTADVSTSDVSGLHDKLDRKRRVENINETVQEKFHSDYIRSIDDLTDELHSFRDKQQHFATGLFDNIEKVLAKQAADASTMTSTLNSVKELANQGLAKIHGAEDLYSSKLQQSLDQHADQCCQTRDAEICRVFDFNDQVATNSLVTINSAMRQIVDDIDQLKCFLTEKMNEQQSVINDFVSRQVKSVEDHKERFEAYFIEHSEWLTKRSDAVTSFYDQQTVANKARMGKVMELLGTAMEMMVKDQETALETFTKTSVELGEVTKSKAEEFKTTGISSLVSVVERSAIERDCIVSSLSQQCEKSHETLELVKQSLNDTNQDIKKVAHSVTEFCNETREVLHTASDMQLQSIQNHKQTVVDNLKRHDSATQEFGGSVTAEVNQLDDMQISNHSQSKTALLHQHESVNINLNEIINWSQDTSNLLQQNKQTVEEFLTKDLQKDIPTGKTPQRREFEYPRILAKTDPHSKLIEEFSLKYMERVAIEREARDKQLPLDSSDEEDETNIQSQQLCLNEDLQDAVDDQLNLSGDSIAMSSASASSFEHTRDSIKREDKENRMKKPSGVPVKVKHHVSKSVSSDTVRDRILSSSNKLSASSLKSSNFMSDKL